MRRLRRYAKQIPLLVAIRRTVTLYPLQLPPSKFGSFLSESFMNVSVF